MSLADANRKLTLKLLAITLASFAFGFALVPLYDVICEVTGFGNQKSLAVAATRTSENPDKARMVTVEFVAARQVRLQGVTVGHRDGFEAMLRAMEQHRLKPVVDRVFAFEELKQAMAYLQSGAQFGKVCLAH